MFLKKINHFFLKKIITELLYQFVLVLNQIDSGTENSPRIFFFEIQNFFFKSFENEGIRLFSIHLNNDKKTKSSCLKQLYSYFSQSYKNLHSFLIGDNIIYYPKILGNQFIFIKKINRIIFFWEKVYSLLRFNFNECSYRRQSKETNIQIFIKIDGRGISNIHTNFGFLDHMIDQICIHANIDLSIKLKGDHYVDDHHIMEDTAISFGKAVSKSLKDKRGISRYGFLLPMDDVLVQIVIDLGGRSKFFWDLNFKREKIGDISTEMFIHFFKSFSEISSCNLYIKAQGNNEHHKIEAIFKAFACVLKMATNRNHDNDRLPSSKEIL